MNERLSANAFVCVYVYVCVCVRFAVDTKLVKRKKKVDEQRPEIFLEKRRREEKREVRSKRERKRRKTSKATRNNFTLDECISREKRLALERKQRTDRQTEKEKG